MSHLDLLKIVLLYICKSILLYLFSEQIKMYCMYQQIGSAQSNKLKQAKLSRAGILNPCKCLGLASLVSWIWSKYASYVNARFSFDIYVMSNILNFKRFWKWMCFIFFDNISYSESWHYHKTLLSLSGNTLFWKIRSPEVTFVSSNANFTVVLLLFVRGLTSVFMFGPGFWNLLSSETLGHLLLWITEVLTWCFGDGANKRNSFSAYS